MVLILITHIDILLTLGPSESKMPQKMDTLESGIIKCIKLGIVI